MKIHVRLIPLLLVVVVGCSQSLHSDTPEKFRTKDDFLVYLMEGYLEANKSLYLVSNGRLKRLYNALGLEEVDSIYTVNKGELLILRKDNSTYGTNELSTLVLSADAPPKFIEAPEKLWNGPCRVFRYSKKEGKSCLDKEKFKRWSNPPVHIRLYQDDYLEFYNGHTIFGNTSIYMDEDARFVCYRKLDKKLGFGDFTYDELEPIYVISVDNPSIKIQSRLQWFPESMFINNNRLYLGTITLNKALPLFHFEVFDISENNQLSYSKDYYLDVPWGFALHTAFMLHYDYQTHSQKLVVYRNFPFPSDTYFYSYGDNRIERLTDSSFIYINPAILENTVQYVDLDKLK